MINVPAPPAPQLSQLQIVRLSFYRSLIKSTRILGGQILVMTADEDDDMVHAILLWLPPHKRLTIGNVSALYRSGFLAALRGYGMAGIYRVNFVFEANIMRMFNEAHVDERECGFVQMLAANPQAAGKRYASQLLKWQVAQHQRGYPGIAVVLDTTTVQGIRTYTRLGFEEIGRIAVSTGTDAVGIKLPKDANEDIKVQGVNACVQRIMVYQPKT